MSLTHECERLPALIASTRVMAPLEITLKKKNTHTENQKNYLYFRKLQFFEATYRTNKLKVYQMHSHTK